MPGPRWSWREASVGAAAFVLGVMIGPSVLRSSQPLPLVSEGGRVVATGALDAALSSLPTGGKSQDPSGTSIGMSFRTAMGQYCRSFAMTRGPAGIACHERTEWVVEVLARNPRPRDGSAPDGYRLAGTPFPEAIRLAISLRKAGEALTLAEESHAMKFHWRSERVLKELPP
ncbi:MAG: hypothetical protein RLZZ393_2064 [Pseudomonadota bacterium]|jgi:hypothetical protein